jgi:thiol-disulfide isomerase/thioredoxin
MAMHAMVIRGLLFVTNQQRPDFIYLKSFTQQANTDTIKIQQDGTFTISLNDTFTEVKRIMINDLGLDFLANPNESDVKMVIELNATQLVAFDVIDSKENDAYKRFLKQNSIFEMGLMNACFIKRDLKLLDSVVVANNSQLAVLSKDYPETFTVKFLVQQKLFAEPKTFQGFAKNYLTKIAVSDSRLLATPLLANHLSFGVKYFSSMAALSDDKWLEAFLDSYNDNLKLKQTVLNLMFKNLLYGNKESEMAAFMRYLKQSNQVLSSKATQIQLDKLLNEMPGKTMAELEAKDGQGKTIVVNNLFNEHQLNLLFFWETDCTHCNQTLPALDRLSVQLAHKDVGFYTLALDDETKKWENKLPSLNANWTNLVLTEKTKSVCFIVYTPTILLLDQKGKILTRLASINEIEQRIKNY